LSDCPGLAHRFVLVLPLHPYNKQVGVFQEYFVPAPSSVKWQSNNTLFSERSRLSPLGRQSSPMLTLSTPAALWFGINDVGFSYTNGYEFPVILPQIGASYNALITLLYTAGGEWSFSDLLSSLTLKSQPATSSSWASHQRSAPPSWPPSARKPSSKSPIASACLTSCSPTMPHPLLLCFPTPTLCCSTRSPSLTRCVRSWRREEGASKLTWHVGRAQILDDPYKYGITDAVDTCEDYINVDLDPLVNLPSCPWPFDQ
jgi:hypothetical protein